MFFKKGSYFYIWLKNWVKCKYIVSLHATLMPQGKIVDKQDGDII